MKESQPDQRKFRFYELGPQNAYHYQQKIREAGADSIIVGNGFSSNLSLATQSHHEFVCQHKKTLTLIDLDGIIIHQSAEVRRGRFHRLVWPELTNEAQDWLGGIVRESEHSIIYTTRRPVSEAKKIWQLLHWLNRTDLSNFPVLSPVWIEKLNTVLNGTKDFSKVYTNKRSLKAKGFTKIIQDLQSLGEDLEFDGLVSIGSGKIDREIFLEYVTSHPTIDSLLIDFGGYWL